MRAIAFRIGLWTVASLAIVLGTLFCMVAVALYVIAYAVTWPMGFIGGAITEVGAMFSWQVVNRSGLWIYSVNSRTGQRRARYTGAGHKPVNRHWLRPGDILIDAQGKRTVQ